MTLIRPVLFCLLAGCLAAQVSTPPKKKVLAIGEVKGFQHDSTSHALATMGRLGGIRAVGHLHSSPPTPNS